MTLIYVLLGAILIVMLFGGERILALLGVVGILIFRLIFWGVLIFAIYYYHNDLLQFAQQYAQNALTSPTIGLVLIPFAGIFVWLVIRHARNEKKQGN